MRAVRGPIAGTVVLTTLALALAGCTGSADPEPAGGPGAGSPAGIPADPKQALAAATKALADGNYSFTVQGPEQQGSGVAHKPSNSARASITFGDAELSETTERIFVAPDLWTRTAVKAPEVPATAPGKWQQIDPALAQDIPNLRFDWATGDLVGGQALMTNVGTAQQAGTGSYTGTTDLSVVEGSPVIDANLVTELGAKAKSVPFTATLDDRGRLSRLTLKLPATEELPAADLTVSYADYGSAAATAKPPVADTEPATEETYENFR